MKITLDQTTLDEAVVNYLRSVGVTSEILKVEFRYTRVPYTVYANVELSETVSAPKRATAVVREEVPAPAPIPLVDPETLPPASDDEVDPVVEPSDTPSLPLFGS